MRSTGRYPGPPTEQQARSFRAVSPPAWARPLLLTTPPWASLLEHSLSQASVPTPVS